MCSALVPFVFSLLKLPYLALENVADCWNTLEMYQFSKISNRTEKIAKWMSKKATRILFMGDPDVYVSISCSKDKSGSWGIYPSWVTQYRYYYDRWQQIPIFKYFSKHRRSELLRVLERAMDIFKNSTIELGFDMDYSRSSDLFSWFNWFAEYPCHVSELRIYCYTTGDIELFIENYTKPTDKLVMELRLDEQVDLREGLEISWMKETQLNELNHDSFNIINIFNSPDLILFDCTATEQDFNNFLKSWKSGATHSKLKNAYFRGPNRLHWGRILDGIPKTYRDPRVVKRFVTVNKKPYWIAGGIDIQKDDGTVGTVRWTPNRVKEENSEVPERMIRHFQRAQETGSDQENQTKWSNSFSMIVW